MIFKCRIGAIESFYSTSHGAKRKTAKVKLDAETHERANKILNLYLPNVDTIFEITDMVYAMGKAVAYTLGVKLKEKTREEPKKQRAEIGENAS